MEDQNLRRASSGNQQPWTDDELLSGFRKYFEVYKRYPTALEIDAFEFLPTSRSIQRSYGGLVAIRKKLKIGDVIDYTKGAYRSKKASVAYKRAQDYEKLFYEYLISKVPEVRVHEHKIIRPGNVACDFFVYTGDTRGIAIDLFYTDEVRSISSIVNTKIKTYKNAIRYPIYFVLMCDNRVDQKKVDAITLNRKILLPDNITVTTEQHFKENFKTIVAV